MQNGMIDNFILPMEATEAFNKQPLRVVNLQDGVNSYVSGSDGPVAYKFFIEAVYNPIESEKCGYEKYDDVEMIKWFVSRREQPTERVKMLPEGLLRFNREGECVGGAFFESYKRFKDGKSAPGLPLNKWGVLSDAECATLSAEGIFSVEQYAALSRDRIVSKFPESFIQAHDRAVKYVAGKDLREIASKNEEELHKIQNENEELRTQLAEIQAHLENLAAQQDSSVQQPKEKAKKVA